MSKIGSFISKSILKIWGWKFKGQYAKHIDKKVMIAAPHTSSIDLFLGLITRSAVQANIQFAGKNSLFKPPLGWFLRAVGGVPVDRSKNSNVVDSIVEIFNSKEKFNFFLAPEGTRKKVEKFRTGFYYIALKAKVPIQMMKLNFKDKILEFSDLFYPTGNIEDDMKFIEDYFRGVIGKNPEKSFF